MLKSIVNVIIITVIIISKNAFAAKILLLD